MSANTLTLPSPNQAPNFRRAAVMAVTLGIGMLAAGCGGGSEQATTPQPNEAPAIATTTAPEQVPSQCRIEYPSDYSEQAKAKKTAACVNAYGIVRDFVVGKEVTTEPVIVPRFGIDPASFDGTDVEDPARVQVTTVHEPGSPYVQAWFRRAPDGSPNYSQLNSLVVLIPSEKGYNDSVYAREQWKPENWTAYSSIPEARVNFMMGNFGSEEGVNAAFAAARQHLQTS